MKSLLCPDLLRSGLYSRYPRTSVANVMSSSDYETAGSHVKRHPSHQRHHTVTASPVPAYVNRSVPTYSLTGQEQPLPRRPESQRYSSNIQPWKRQQPQSSLSFVPSTSPRSERFEYALTQPKRSVDRSAAFISPFRSVRRMKEPFQLRLPSSPSLEPSSAATRESQMSSRPADTRSLRAWRSDQNLMASSLETFGLLPSPPLSDSQPSQASPASTYFSSKPGSETENEPDTENCTCLSQTASCSRCNVQTPATDVSTHDHPVEATNVHMAHSNFVRQCELAKEQSTPATTASGYMSPPTTCSDIDSIGRRDFSGSSVATQRSRSGTASSEGSWVPSSLSYCETWLQGAPADSSEEEADKSMVSNRRKFQIVQKGPLAPDWNHDRNDAVCCPFT